MPYVNSKVLSSLDSEVLKSIRSEIDSILKQRNSASPCVGGRDKVSEHAERWLSKILKEDWSHLFESGSYSDDSKYYVYMHCDPRIKHFNPGDLNMPGMPFYVGKGAGERYSSMVRSKPHKALIREILDAGYHKSEIFFIYKKELNEAKAFEIESKLITFFGCRAEISRMKRRYFNGRKSGMLVNTDSGIRPDWVGQYILNAK